MKSMAIKSQKGNLYLYALAIVGVASFYALVNAGLILQLAGKVAWTGVNATAISTILNTIINGASIGGAVAAVVGVALGGPVTAALTAIGRGMLIKWVKQRGFSSVVKF
ncbi:MULTISPECIES: putative cyclic bacteriocin [Bacillus]|uniref:putative cyclic bacteriocin n=1 Tax=Bacillus TaxID=1386 RepID=UPI00119FF36B|nr:putative cyclic bacteriocin [Bacillus thuringiensis]